LAAVLSVPTGSFADGASATPSADNSTQRKSTLPHSLRLSTHAPSFFECNSHTSRHAPPVYGLQHLGKRPRTVDETPPQPAPDREQATDSSHASTPAAILQRPLAKRHATKVAVKTKRGPSARTHDTSHGVSGQTAAGVEGGGVAQLAAAAAALPPMIVAAVASHKPQARNAARLVEKQPHSRIRDAVAAGPAVGCSAAVSAVAPPTAAAPAVKSTDTAVWIRENAVRETYWSGESALYLFTRASTHAGDTTTKLVLAKRYHHAACCTHERAVFDYLAAHLSTQERRDYVRNRLPPESRPEPLMLIQMQDHYVSKYRAENPQCTAYHFSAADDSPLVVPRPGQPAAASGRASEFLSRLRMQQPQTRSERVAAISKRVEWFHRYDYTMDEAIFRPSRWSAHDGPAQPPQPRPVLDPCLANLRSRLFWRLDPGSDRASWPLMEKQTERLVLHLFECLAVHHRVGVLLGDIKPGNMFVNYNSLPVFGDYGHATVFDKSGKRALHLGRIQPNPNAAARLQYRSLAQEAGGLSPLMQEAVVSRSSSAKAAPAAAASHPKLRLTGTCGGIGTSSYRATEASKHGIYTERSDMYSLAVSLIELLVGYTAQISRDPTHAQRTATSTQLQRLAQLRDQCAQLHQFSQQASTSTSTKQEWLQQGALARVPVPLIQLLRHMIEPPRVLGL